METTRLNTTKKVAYRFMITGVPSEERPSYTDIVLKVPFICLFFFQLRIIDKFNLTGIVLVVRGPDYGEKEI